MPRSMNGVGCDRSMTVEDIANGAAVRETTRAVLESIVSPVASDIDESQDYPVAVVQDLGRLGFIGAMLPEPVGRGFSASDYGVMTEEVGAVCSNTRNLIAVQDMVLDAVWRWGTADHRERWASRIVSGSAVASFALSEPDVGSDAADVRTVARRRGGAIEITGVKTWISFAQLAELFLVFVNLDGQHTALLVPADTPGLTVVPITGMLGLRGSMLATITFEQCVVSSDSVVGPVGAGLMFVASGALDIGRLSTAWGSVGLAQACLEASISRSEERLQGGKVIRQHQLVQRLITDQLADTRAARLLCSEASRARDEDTEDAVYETLLAKYFASRAASRSSSAAVQMHGASGMTAGSLVSRFFRDAKAGEIIEGTSEVLQHLIGTWKGAAKRPGNGHSR